MDLGRIFKSKAKKIEEKEKLKKLLKEKYSYFRTLLHTNNDVLRIMADMEEKLSGEYVFDVHYIKTNVNAISNGVIGIIKNLNALSDNKYAQLENVY